MPTFSRLLHPTDFSDCSRDAMGLALDLAVRFGAELHVLHIGDGAPRHAAGADPVVPEEADLEVRLREGVNAHLGRLDQAQVDRLQVVYSLGRDVAPAPAIVRYAEAQRIDAVVMGTHGRRGLRRVLLGSVSTEVLYSADCDVLTVRDYDRAAAVPGWGRHILVPVDLTPPSMQVIAEAGAMARLFDARLTILHVLEPVPLPADYSVGAVEAFEMMLPRLKWGAAARLEQMCEEAGVQDRASVHIGVGPVARTVSELASVWGVDLIMMASWRQWRSRRFGLGHITDRVVRSATCPVWVLRTPADAAQARYARAAAATTT